MNCLVDMMAELQIPFSSSHEKLFKNLFSSGLLIDCNLFCEDAGGSPSVSTSFTLCTKCSNFTFVWEKMCFKHCVVWTVGCFWHPAPTVELLFGYISETLGSHHMRSALSCCWRDCNCLVKTVSHCYRDGILHCLAWSFIVKTFSFSSCIYFWCCPLQFIRWALRTLSPGLMLRIVDLCIDSLVYIQSINTALPLMLHTFYYLLFDWMATHNLLGLENTFLFLRCIPTKQTLAVHFVIHHWVAKWHLCIVPWYRFSSYFPYRTYMPVPFLLLVFALRFAAHWNIVRASTCSTCTPWNHNVHIDTGCGNLGSESLGQIWINLDHRKKFKFWIIFQLEGSLTCSCRFVSCRMWHTANVGRYQHLKEMCILSMSTGWNGNVFIWDIDTCVTSYTVSHCRKGGLHHHCIVYLKFCYPTKYVTQFKFTWFQHGDMEQRERDLIMRQFRTGSSRVLITTDLLARSIDVQQVSSVINYDLKPWKLYS